MSLQEWLICIGIAVIAAFFALTIIGAVMRRKKLDKDGFSDGDFKEPSCEVFYAKVIDIKCDIAYNKNVKGIRTPELIKNFMVSFELEHGEVLTLCVPEEYYGAFEIGQEGALTFANEQFVAFALWLLRRMVAAKANKIYRKGTGGERKVEKKNNKYCLCRYVYSDNRGLFAYYRAFCRSAHDADFCRVLCAPYARRQAGLLRRCGVYRARSCWLTGVFGLSRRICRAFRRNGRLYNRIFACGTFVLGF